MGDSFIERELQSARQKLLDLTMRNRLLNHKPSKVKTLPIVDELPRELFDILVGRGKAMHFLAKKKKTEDTGKCDDAQEDRPENSGEQLNIWTLPDPESTPEDHHTDLALQTNIEPDALQRRLFQISNQSEAFVAEQGYTVLHLALGFLEWYESPAATTPKRAPLILIPVKLTRKGVKKSFELQWTEEDVQENVSLRAKLSELGVELPAPEEGIQTKEDLINYLQEVKTAVEDQTRWKVVNNVVLDFFSFTKFVMYKDLDPTAWPNLSELTKSGALRDVLDPDPNTDFGSDFDPDTIDTVLDPANIYHVMDADPSQIAVIEEVKAGRNLVVEGPPGTGKSQTITNMIAELMAAGKSILFVSEKMAALSVVKDRLTRVGLGSFCAEIHSRKANKRAFLEQLKESSELQFQEPKEVEAELAELTRLRNSLNDYARVLATPIGKLQMTVAEAFQMHSRSTSHFEASGRKPIRLKLGDAFEFEAGDVGQALEVLQELGATLNEVAPVASNPWRSVKRTNLLPPDREEVKVLFSNLKKSIQSLQDAMGVIEESCSAKQAEDLNEIPGLLIATRGMISPPKMEVSIVEGALQSERRDRVALLDKLQEFVTLRVRTLDVLNPGTLDRDCRDIESEFKSRANKNWFARLFDSRYKALKKEIATLYPSGSAPSDSEAQQDLARLRQAQDARKAVRSEEELGKQVFGSAWEGETSELDSLKAMDQWLYNLTNNVKSGLVLQDFSYQRVLDTQNELGEAVGRLEPLARSIEEDWSALVTALEANGTTALGGELNSLSLDSLLATFETMERELGALIPWTRFAAQLKSLSGTVAAPMRDPILNSEIEASVLLPTFENTIAESVIRHAFETFPELQSFSPAVHEDRIKRYAELDRKIIQLNRHRLAAKLSTSRPRIPVGASPKSEAGILAGQFNRKRNHLPIRKLMESCGTIIQGITPCFMMSPLSVAQFLDPRRIKFDVVIFDEASQVRPQEALGALMRANQAVVIGDTQQLPPTNFFDKVAEDDEADEEGATGIAQVESILHQCRRSFKTKRLTWHYRSEHDSLIAISNREFYSNELRVFPSRHDAGEDYGLSLRRINSPYDRGVSATNRGEARAVAEAVIRHYQANPEISLGVGTFSTAQMNAILQEIEAARQEHPELDIHFGSGQAEPFFVKNLESIQGDERDIILVSVGYGFDSNDQLRVNFGPINNEGGERRLNVLFTRARKQCIVFSNFSASQLRLEGSSSKGLVVLKAILEYAETGVLSELETSRADADSPFEVSVAQVLREKGYEVTYQVGCSGYRVDLGVRDPAARGSYMLGVECDGAKYHSSRVARDRDRLRQDVLEKLGWTIHRVWSTDWYRNNSEARRKLLEAVEAARFGSKHHGETRESSETAPAEILSLPVKAPENAIPIPPYQTCTNLGDKPSVEFHLASPAMLAGLIEKIVAVESPIHIDEVTRRLRSTWGVGRAGSRIRDAVKRGVKSAIGSGVARKEGDFLWHPSMEVAPLRARGKDDNTDINMICGNEIVVAIKQVLVEQYAMPIEDLVVQVSRTLGIRSTRAKVAARIEAVVRELLESRQLLRPDSELVDLAKRLDERAG